MSWTLEPIPPSPSTIRNSAKRWRAPSPKGAPSAGVLICGTGIGVSIAANRHPGIRAAVCHDPKTACLARQHNDANVLVFGGRIIDEETALACLKTFLETEFEGGRHQRRVAMLG